jgi:hypothetical protein
VIEPDLPYRVIWHRGHNDKFVRLTCNAAWLLLDMRFFGPFWTSAFPGLTADRMWRGHAKIDAMNLSRTSEWNTSKV